MDATQRFSFDVAGYCVVDDCLSPSHVEELRALIAREIPIVGTNRSITSAGSGPEKGTAAYGFWDQAVFDLVDHARISPIMEELFEGDDHRRLTGGLLLLLALLALALLANSTAAPRRRYPLSVSHFSG